MKRTCAWCRVIYDDGLRWPKDWPRIPAHKNHGICPVCAPMVEKGIDDLMAEKQRREHDKK